MDIYLFILCGDHKIGLFLCILGSFLKVKVQNGGIICVC